MKVIRARNIMQMWQVYLVSPGKVLKQKGNCPRSNLWEPTPQVLPRQGTPVPPALQKRLNN